MRVSVSGFIFSLAAAFALAMTGPAMAQRTPSDFADLVERLTPAVVNISSAQTVNADFGNNTQMEQFEEKFGSQATSLGSGFIIDPDGIVVTNKHVVEKADEITVTLSNGDEYKAEVVAMDRETDLAVLRMETDERMPFVDFGSSNGARVGEWVVAIGNPFGLGGSVSVGIISARNRDIRAGLYDDFIQTDAAINRGNSGGPLFNMAGEVIGINTVIFSQTGGSVGVGFAVPSDLASTVIEQLLEFGETRRGWLGVTLDDISDQRASAAGLPNNDGAVVLVVRGNSPAEKAGLQRDDFIVEFNSRKISEMRDLTRAVADTPVGSTVPVKLYRDGRLITVQVTVDRRETNLASNFGNAPLLAEDLPDDAVVLSGLILQQPTAEVRDAYGLADDVAGVVVTAIESDSPMSGILQIGDVITELGYNDVGTPKEMADRMEKLRNLNSGPLQIEVRRGNITFIELINP
ncbi:Do family serine endopeptidase [Aquisalinus flavus]|uniref:Probable periplasmic serine endoprotease DegP-like n=1 Tax=Aquisalinus flavus TaxID=1526572 RepID=A0A8J2V4D2_9PROT|nr:Do family serine endopeptidase [Aquisalinus flavus]MBD0427482.1 Do family serine endopeptidase [Aquisalinus flavus]UNE47278.1 Do family serine endopeptidase [Aquisalinus flavus]GGD01331.1 serine protease [Aquisalinus flavus]